MKTIRQLLTCVAVFFAAQPARAQNPPGVPEPGLFLYGPVVNPTNNQPVPMGVVQWQVAGAGDSATIAGTCVNVNGAQFYVARIPFETRSASGQSFTRTPGTFDLKAAVTNYTRAATADGLPATLLSSSRGMLGNFTFGAVDRGLLERVVLGVNRAPISNVDTDGDGLSDYAESVAGTNPNDRNSFLRVSPDLGVTPNGSLIVKWASVAGRKYAVYRTATLGQPFQLLATDLPATAPLNTYTDSSAPGAPALFYRIQVCQ